MFNGNKMLNFSEKSCKINHVDHKSYLCLVKLYVSHLTVTAAEDSGHSNSTTIKRCYTELGCASCRSVNVIRSWNVRPQLPYMTSPTIYIYIYIYVTTKAGTQPN